MNMSSRHLASMVAGGLAVAVLVPSAAVAVATTLVSIKDPVTSSKARVDAGALRTNDAIESMPWTNFDRAANNASDRIVLVGPTSRTIALSSLTASATDGPVGVRIRAVATTTGTCQTGPVTVVDEVMSFAVPAGASQSVSFPSPIVEKPTAGQKICLIAHPDTTYIPASEATLTVSGSGFLR